MADIVPAKSVEPPVELLPVAPEPAKAKTKSTPSLKGIFNTPAAVEQVAAAAISKPNEPIIALEMRKAWDMYTEQRKDQAAEYQILKREYQFVFPTISIILTNPVEESLLENFRRELIQYLRDQLKNNEITVVPLMQQATGKKVIYTSKEKFEHLAEKNPYLNELKERLGLDWEF